MGKKDSFPLAPTGIRAKTRHDSLDDEMPLLLDPCRDDPDAHLRFYFDSDRPVSLVLAKELIGDPDYSTDEGRSLKGEVSIHVYGLNRLRLVQARTQILRNLEFLANVVIETKALAQALQNHAELEVAEAGRKVDSLGDRVLTELIKMSSEDQPYSSMVRAWLSEFLDSLDN